MRIAGILKQPKSHEWETPIELFKQLDEEFEFGLDAAASADNTLCQFFFTARQDALGLQWWTYGSVFCNPPYGTQIGRWVEKGWREAQKGCTVVMLIPARTETTYWHNFVMHAAEIRFIRGRLRFSGASVNAPFPSAVVVFRRGWFGVPEISTMEVTR